MEENKGTQIWGKHRHVSNMAERVRETREKGTIKVHKKKRGMKKKPVAKRTTDNTEERKPRIG